MEEKAFKCSKCGDVTKETDFSFKDRNLYYALEKEGVCEACARGIKSAVVKLAMQRKPCPIEGCRKTWLTESGLEAHLYAEHIKSELVGFILKKVREEGKYYRVPKRESFR